MPLCLNTTYRQAATQTKTPQELIANPRRDFTGLLVQRPLKFNSAFPIIPMPDLNLLHLPKYATICLRTRSGE